MLKFKSKYEWSLRFQYKNFKDLHLSIPLRGLKYWHT